MKKPEDRIRTGLSFWCIVYPSAVIVGRLIWLFRKFGWIRISGFENLPQEGSVLLVSNHPSLWEPIILPCLFFLQYWFPPVRRIPYCVADSKNYVDTWYWGGLKSRFISVTREKRKNRLAHRAIEQIIGVLKIGGDIVFFPEGGRTGKGEEFLYSCSGKPLRCLKPGIGKILCNVNCIVVPIWVDGAEKVLPIGEWFPRFWRGITITVGPPIVLEEIKDSTKDDRNRAISVVTDALLKTAD
jgi:1-acyl-sn-glycerol-3-phosphate acyltransferase